MSYIKIFHLFIYPFIKDLLETKYVVGPAQSTWGKTEKYPCSCGDYIPVGRHPINHPYVINKLCSIEPFKICIEHILAVNKRGKDVYLCAVYFLA